MSCRTFTSRKCFAVFTRRYVELGSLLEERIVMVAVVNEIPVRLVSAPPPLLRNCRVRSFNSTCQPFREATRPTRDLCEVLNLIRISEAGWHHARDGSSGAPAQPGFPDADYEGAQDAGFANFYDEENWGDEDAGAGETPSQPIRVARSAMADWTGCAQKEEHSGM